MIRAVIRAAILALVFAAQTATASSDQDALPDLTAVLADAAQALEDAQTAEDQLAALSQAIAAYEEAQAELRRGLRRNAQAQAILRAELDAGEAERAALIGALTQLAPLAGGGAVLHPDGPLATARAGMVMADLFPRLHAEIAALSREHAYGAALIETQSQARATLQEGLNALQQARRDALDAARRNKPPPNEDAALRAKIAADAQSFAELSQNLPPSGAPDLSSRDAAILPVTGKRLRQFDEPDAAGIARPGWVMATEAQALVRAPLTASVLYAGPIQGQGQVVVLETAPEQLIILAGLSALLTSTGATVLQGEGLGFTGSQPALRHTNMTTDTEGAGTSRTDTLYIELRTGEGPVDPSGLFASQED